MTFQTVCASHPGMTDHYLQRLKDRAVVAPAQYCTIVKSYPLSLDEEMSTFINALQMADCVESITKDIKS